MNRTRTTVAALAVIFWGCSVPSVQPLYGPDSLLPDAGLVGEWVSEGPTVTRVGVSEGSDGRYRGALAVHHEGELKTVLNLELSVTQIGEDRYVDLYLAKPDREGLAARYGFLALPVHQFMMTHREGDVLRVWAFDPNWLKRAAADHAFACEILPIGGQSIAVVTADSGTFREFLREHAHDPGSLLSPMVFHRLRQD
jgi:hypothetical protein